MMMVAGGDGVVVEGDVVVGDGVVGATEVLDEDEISMSGDEEVSVISEQFTAPTPHVYFPSGHERQTSMSAL